MAPKAKADLLKVGLEGFAMLDASFPTKGKSFQQPPAQQCLYRYQPKATYVHQVILPVSATGQVTMDCYEAAKIYGGAVIADYPNQKPIRMA